MDAFHQKEEDFSWPMDLSPGELCETKARWIYMKKGKCVTSRARYFTYLFQELPNGSIHSLPRAVFWGFYFLLSTSRDGV
jgi:hypothetical protein